MILSSHVPPVAKYILLFTSLHIFLLSVETYARSHGFGASTFIFTTLWSVEVKAWKFCARHYATVVTITRPSIAVVGSLLFLDVFVRQGRFALVGMGYFLAALAAFIVALKLLADALHNNTLKQTSAALYRNMDFGLYSVVKAVLRYVASNVHVIQSLKRATAFLQRVVLLTFDVLFQLRTKLLQPALVLLKKIIVTIWRNPALTWLATIAALAAAYYVSYV